MPDAAARSVEACRQLGLGTIRGVPAHSGPDHASDLNLFLAEWVLGRADPDAAVRRALRALDDGCDDASIAVIAGSTRPTRADIETELHRLLRVSKTEMPSPEAALKVLVDGCALRIADGRTDPVHGAWMMVEFWANEDESKQFLDQVRRLVDLVCDWDNAGRRVAAPCDEIVAQARAFLDRGGLRLRETRPESRDR